MSFNFIKKDTISESLFFKLPKALMFESKYENLSANAKLLYPMLLDRVSISVMNNWFDKNDNAYIICELTEIELYLRCSRNTASKALKELVNCNLVKKFNQGQGKANFLYIATIETTCETLEKHICSFRKHIKSIKDKRALAKKIYKKESANKQEYKNCTPVENTNFEKSESSKQLEILRSTKNELLGVQNLYPNKNYINKTISMYVCNNKSNLKKSQFIEITKKYLCLSSYSEKELDKFDSKIDFDLFEKVLIKIINNNKINDKEQYLIKTISTLIDKNIVTLDQYVKSIEEYNKKYIDKKQSNLNSSNRTKNIKPRTTQHEINQTYKKYSADELENMLFNNQKSKFENVKTLTKKSINEKLANNNRSDHNDFEWDY